MKNIFIHIKDIKLSQTGTFSSVVIFTIHHNCDSLWLLAALCLCLSLASASVDHHLPHFRCSLSPSALCARVFLGLGGPLHPEVLIRIMTLSQQHFGHFKMTPLVVWYTPIIFLPISWNILLFFRSSSINFRFSSVSCSLRFRASASRSAFDRNLGWKVMTDVWGASIIKRRQKGLSLKTFSPWPLLPLLLSFLQEVLPEIKVGPVQKHQSIN